MGKGRYGISLSFYAVAAFLLAMFGNLTLCTLLLGFVIAAERNQWLIKQVIQAWTLSLAGIILQSVISWFGQINRYAANGNVTEIILWILSWFVSVAVIILGILSAVKVSKGQEAKIPFGGKLSDWAYGLVRQKAYNQPPYAQPQYGQPQPKQHAYQPQQYGQQPTPQQPQPASQEPQPAPQQPPAPQSAAQRPEEAPEQAVQQSMQESAAESPEAAPPSKT